MCGVDRRKDHVVDGLLEEEAEDRAGGEVIRIAWAVWEIAHIKPHYYNRR